jgi:hypothetical protein
MLKSSWSAVLENLRDSGEVGQPTVASNRVL